MARRRHQDPKLEPKGNFWWARIYKDVFVDGKRTRQRQRIKIAPITMGKREAEKVKDEIVGRENRGLITTGSAANFMDYVNTEYNATRLPKLASTTQASYKGAIRKYLLPAFGECCLRDLTTGTLDRFFLSLAEQGLPHASIVKVRDPLSSILRQAKKDKFLTENPLEEVDLPRDNSPDKQKPYIQPDDFTNLLALIQEPYSTMVYTAVWTGLRVSELIALKWRCVNMHKNTIAIEQRYCRGDWAKPKTKASAATIPVAPHVIARIQRLKTLTVAIRAGRAMRHYNVVKADGPNDLVFQSLKDGRPMNDQNILKRHIQPAAEKLKLHVTWRALRTSHCTWLIEAGADVKSVQAQMRHSTSKATMDIYAQVVLDMQKKALEKLTEFAGGVPLADAGVPLVSQKIGISDHENWN